MRKTVALALSMLMMIVTGFAWAPSASAYHFFSSACRWNATTVYYYNSGSTSAYVTMINNATSSWNGLATQAKFSRTTTYGSRNFTAYNSNAGNTGWTGVTRKPGTATGFPDCTSTRWVSGGMEVVVNTYYNNSTQQQGVLVHEFGHSLGLAHENTRTAQCPFGNYIYKAIMYYSDDRFYGSCAIFTPQPDDVAGVNALY